jgi:hypothetical protein
VLLLDHHDKSAENPDLRRRALHSPTCIARLTGISANPHHKSALDATASMISSR